jgi:hypothetical protein
MAGIKVAGSLLFLLISSVLGYKVYGYYFTKGSPEISFVGLNDDCHYSGNLNFFVKCAHKHKVKDISISLDDKPLVSNASIGKNYFDFPVSLPKGVSNGKHKLRVTARAGTYNQPYTTKECNFIVDNSPLQIAFVRPGFDYKVFQGRTLHVQFQANKKLKNAQLKSAANIYNCFPEASNSTIYECFMPVPCEEIPNEYPYEIVAEDMVGNTAQLDGKFQVIPFAFKKQVLKVSGEKLKYEAEVSLPQEELEKELEKLFPASPSHKLWNGSFYLPMEMTGISCDYGVKRVTQEKGCYVHKALDLVGAPKTVVWAPQDGTIVIKKRYAGSGNTVVIDHGHGIFTLLFHLEDFANINEGDKVKRGNPIGKMGMTGYATGYHLHWEMRINNIHVDPMQWAKDDF